MPADDTRYEFIIDERDAGFCEEYGLIVTCWKSTACVCCTETQLQYALGLA
jgi:hypothetical protein